MSPSGDSQVTSMTLLALVSRFCVGVGDHPVELAPARVGGELVPVQRGLVAVHLDGQLHRP